MTEQRPKFKVGDVVIAGNSEMRIMAIDWSEWSKKFSYWCLPNHQAVLLSEKLLRKRDKASEEGEA